MKPTYYILLTVLCWLFPKIILSQSDSILVITGGIPITYGDFELPGIYNSTKKMDALHLNIKADSTYKQEWSSCTFEFIAKGNWKVIDDTLILIPSNIKAKRSQAESESVVSRCNKIQIAYDTLTVLFYKNGSYNPYFRVSK